MVATKNGNGFYKEKFFYIIIILCIGAFGWATWISFSCAEGVEYKLKEHSDLEGHPPMVKAIASIQMDIGGLHKSFDEFKFEQRAYNDKLLKVIVNRNEPR